jgi:hypothetical protein
MGRGHRLRHRRERSSGTGRETLSCTSRLMPCRLKRWISMTTARSRASSVTRSRCNSWLSGGFVRRTGSIAGERGCRGKRPATFDRQCIPVTALLHRQRCRTSISIHRCAPGRPERGHQLLNAQVVGDSRSQRDVRAAGDQFTSTVSGNFSSDPVGTRTRNRSPVASTLYALR